MHIVMVLFVIVVNSVLLKTAAIVVLKAIGTAVGIPACGKPEQLQITHILTLC